MTKSNKKLVYGAGVNDADYFVNPTVSGKRVLCSCYLVWQGMLQRCYSPEYQDRQPTYIGCTVCEEWLSFMAFRSWMIRQDWQGKHLDKDLIHHGNKVYSPDNCIFISRAINSLFNDHASKRGKYAQGVNFDKRRNKYIAQCSVSGNIKHLGRYKTEQEASKAYKDFKLSHCLSIADKQEDERLKQAITRKAKLLFGASILTTKQHNRFRDQMQRHYSDAGLELVVR